MTDPCVSKGTLVLSSPLTLSPASDGPSSSMNVLLMLSLSLEDQTVLLYNLHLQFLVFMHPNSLIMLHLLISSLIFSEATPKTIMRVMGVKGLTLYHLKSHLQVNLLTHNFFFLLFLCLTFTTFQFSVCLDDISFSLFSLNSFVSLPE